MSGYAYCGSSRNQRSSGVHLTVHCGGHQSCNAECLVEFFYRTERRIVTYNTAADANSAGPVGAPRETDMARHAGLSPRQSALGDSALWPGLFPSLFFSCSPSARGGPKLIPRMRLSRLPISNLGPPSSRLAGTWRWTRHRCRRRARSSHACCPASAPTRPACRRTAWLAPAPTHSAAPRDATPSRSAARRHAESQTETEADANSAAVG